MSNFTEPDQEIEYARARWESGAARIERAGADTRRREVLERVVEALVGELERRVGQTFTTVELARAHGGADTWALEIAHEVAPDVPAAWELDGVMDCAFHRYARRASDYQA